MEQEFSWTGLLLSLSIAFFVVIFSAFCLGFLHSVVLQAHNNSQKLIQQEKKIEIQAKNYLPVDFSGQKLERLENLNLA